MSFCAMRWECLHNMLFQSSQHRKTEHMNVNMNSFYKCTKPYRCVVKQHQTEGRSTRDTNESENVIHMMWPLMCLVRKLTHWPTDIRDTGEKKRKNGYFLTDTAGDLPQVFQKTITILLKASIKLLHYSCNFNFHPSVLEVEIIIEGKITI